MINLPKQLVIAIDCDDVLVATTPFLIDAYNQKYGTSVSLEDSHNTDNYEIWGANRELQVQRLDELMRTEAYAALGPSEGEARILNNLSDYHFLHLITARKPEEYELTQAMIDRDLPDVFQSLDFVGWTGSKGEVCKRIGADILIDDSIRHLKDALTWGLPKGRAILFGEYPWNSEPTESLKGIIRCRDWNEVEAAVNEISNEK